MDGVMNPWVIEESTLTIRMIIAAFLGGAIGWERERNRHAAGMRTHMLVSLGSALIMVLSLYGFHEFVNETNVRIDPSRFSAQVVSGIGFIGAGTIIHNGLSVKGLTTAASIWVSAALGLAVGAGFYYGAVLTCVLTIIALWFMNRVDLHSPYQEIKHVYRIEAVDTSGELISSIRTTLSSLQVKVKNLDVVDMKVEALNDPIQAELKGGAERDVDENGDERENRRQTGTGISGESAEKFGTVKEGQAVRATQTVEAGKEEGTSYVRRMTIEIGIYLHVEADPVDIVERLTGLIGVRSVRGL